MEGNVYHIDAFTNTIFGGNPACVVPLDSWPDDELLLQIARENAMPETAFFVASDEEVQLRWFTPDIEMDLCGHATLAAAHALKTIMGYPGDKIVFTSHSGVLTVEARDGVYTLDFPARSPQPVVLPLEISEALSIQPQETFLARDYVLVYRSEREVRHLEIDRKIFDQIDLGTGGVAVTAMGVKHCDFVSRFFTPKATILEDPVTGSSHCSLVPLWAERLGRNVLTAVQLSERGGKLQCEYTQGRVLLSGEARTYSIGRFWTE